MTDKHAILKFDDLVVKLDLTNISLAPTGYMPPVTSFSYSITVIPQTLYGEYNYINNEDWQDEENWDYAISEITTTASGTYSGEM